jgi:OmcA/MtrC family decaheme c-type cytochrome
VLAPAYHEIDWVKGVLVETDNTTVPPTITEMQCNECHNAAWVAPWDGVTKAPQLADLHVGFDKKIYASNGTRFADVIKAAITDASYDSTTRELSFKFSITKTDPAGVVSYGVANIVPQLMIGPYGWNTKDWAQGYFSQDVGGAKKTGVTLVTNGQTSGSWEIKVDLDGASASWKAYLDAGTLRRIEIGIRPWVVASTSWAVLPAANPAVALTGPEMALNSVTRTFDLGTAAFADAFYKPIVDVAKCNKCHDALATTFHEVTGEKNRGGSIVACRMCHTPRTAGGHLEMQSRSLDSYVHSIHSFQAFDIRNYNFADELSTFQYEHHTSATYPYFTTLACESCHNAGTYNPPSDTQSLPGVLSASMTVTGKVRAINGVPSVVTGPGSRACGGCHRAMFINEDNAAGLSNFDTHTKLHGYREPASTLDATIQKVGALNTP